MRNAWASFLRGFLLDAVHLRAFVGMETLKILKDPTEMLSRSLQPVLWLVVFGGAMNHANIIPTAGTSYLAFLAPGIMAQSITFVSVFNGLSIIWERDMGLLQRTLSTPVRRSIIVLGKMLAGSVRALSQMVVVLLISVLIGIDLKFSPGRLAGVVTLMVLGSAFFSGLSMIIASIVKTRERMMGIGQLVTMPLFFASNALYPVSVMPPWLKVLSSVNPLTYLVSGLRRLLLEPSYAGVGIEIAVLACVSLLALAIATRLYPRLLH